jgi:hypothetical protein
VTTHDPIPPDPSEDELLDEALDESFPASDPPAMTEPSGPRDNPAHEQG